MAAHSPQPSEFAAPQFRLPLDVPSIQPQPPFFNVAEDDCEQPYQQEAPGAKTEANKFKPLVWEVERMVSKWDPTGQDTLAAAHDKYDDAVFCKQESRPSLPFESL